MAELRIQRLLLRQWRERDHVPFAALNADADVMRYLPAPLTREQSDALANRARTAIAQQGVGLCAVEITSSGSFIGSWAWPSPASTPRSRSRGASWLFEELAETTAAPSRAALPATMRQ